MFKIVKLMAKERQDVVGVNCLKDEWKYSCAARGDEEMEGVYGTVTECRE